MLPWRLISRSTQPTGSIQLPSRSSLDKYSSPCFDCSALQTVLLKAADAQLNLPVFVSLDHNLIIDNQVSLRTLSLIKCRFCSKSHQHLLHSTISFRMGDTLPEPPPHAANEVTTRSYQQEMLDASLVENIIIAQDTGSGKTHIAVLRMKIECDREPHKVTSSPLWSGTATYQQPQRSRGSLHQLWHSANSNAM